MSSAVVALPKIVAGARTACTRIIATRSIVGRLLVAVRAAAASLGSRSSIASMRNVGRSWSIAAATVAALVLGLVPAAPAQAAATTSSSPVTADVTAPHPRLMENGAGFASLANRVSSDDVSASLYTTVLKNADAMLGAPVVTYSKPDGARLLDTSRLVLDRSYTLMLAWKVSGNAKYADRLWTDLDAAANFPDWNPDHFLDTAEMTHAFAVAYDWGYSYWDASKQDELRQAILDKGLAPSQKVYDATTISDAPYKYLGNWSMRADNVNIVINSAMAMGALAVANDTSSPLPQRILDESFASIRIGLGAYGPDGGFKEGPTYWDYATRYLTSFLGALKTATGSDYGLTAAPGLAQTASFMEAMTGPGGQYYGFGDSITQFQPAASYAGLASLFNDPATMTLAASTKSSAFTPLQLVFRDASTASPTAGPAPTPLQNTFAAAGVTSMTGSRSDTRASYAAFRFGADPAASHQHFDAGDFDFQALGQEWAVDLGMESGTYDLLAQDRANARWNYYRTRAEGHNTLAIDPFDPNAGNKTGATTLVDRGADVDSAYAVADLSASYPDEVSSWRRGVRLFDNRSQLLVQDEITAPGAVDALWSMHTGAEVQVAADGRSAVLYQNGERVLARIVSPGDLSFVRMAAAPLPTSPAMTQTSNDGISKLAIAVKGSNNVTVAVQLTPLRHGMTLQAAPAPVVPTALSTWSVAGGSAPLSGITVNGTSVPGFRADQSSYTVTVPAGSAVPVVAATAPAGTVTVQQATSVPGRARVTVSGAGGAPTTYVVELELARIKIVGVSTPIVSSGWGSATFDGNPTTYWGADAATANATWDIGTPAVVDTTILSWRANSAKKVVFEIATSNDKATWVARYAGSYVGPSADQAVKLSAGPASRYVRLTVHGDGAKVTNSMLNEVQLFDYDVRSEYPPVAASRPSAVSLTGVPSSMTAGQLATAATSVTWTGTAGPAPAYRYVTGDPAVATVDQNGTVTATGGGTTQIGVLASAAGTTVTSNVAVTVADATKLRVYADADTYVQSSTPGTNYGSQYGMLVKPSVNGSADRVGYLHFDLSALAGKTVTSAVLTTESVITDNLASPATERIDAHVATGSFSETSLTYPDRPDLGATIGSFVAERTKKTTQSNISAYVTSYAKNGAGDLTVGLTQDDAGNEALLTTVSSRESGAGAYIDVTLTPPALGITAAVASATTSGSANATFDGDPATAWSVDTNPGWVRWQLTTPAHVGSVVLSWLANSAKKTVFEVETSNDATTWTRRYTGQYTGESGDQTVSLGSGVSVKYVRVVGHGDGGAVPTTTLGDVKLLGYDATTPAPNVPATILKSVSVSGLGSSVNLGSTTQAATTVRDSLGGTVANADVAYTSTNPDVASVSPTGVVTAATTGTTTLTVTATAAGTSVTTSVPVTVVDPARIRLYAQADTYVESSSATTNYGTQYGMLAKPPVNGSADRVALLGFDLSPLVGKTVTSAVLTTENVISDGTTQPATVRVDAHAVTGSWDETAVTYATKPSVGATVGSLLSTRTKATTSADLTDYVTSLAASGTSAMSLGLTQDDASSTARLVTVSSRESGKGAYLDVTLAPAQPAAVPPAYLKSVSLGGLGSTLDLGESAQATLTAKDSLGKAFTRADLAYTSSSPDVASVSSTGAVTAGTPGTTTITVTATADGLSATDSATVKVADATRVRLLAQTDTYVESSSAGTNYGTQYGMLVKPPVNGSADRVALLGFDLSTLAGKTVTSAVLTTENVITDSTTTPGTVRVDAHAVTGSWDETGATYASKPALGATVGSFLSTRTKATTSADLTDYVTTLAGSSAGSMSLGLTQDDAGSTARLVTVSTRESGKGAYLDVTLAPAQAAAVPPTYLKSVALSGLGATVELGSSTQAKTTVKDSLGSTFPRADVSYTSTNPDVASVSSTGVVTAATTGSATITATATANGLTTTDSVAVKVVDSTKIRIYASADTYVQSSTATTNYGTATGMLVKPTVNGSPDRVGYVRFDLSPLAGKTVTSAVLTTESVISDGTTSPSTVRVDAHNATGSWTETGMTYSGRPTLGPTIGSFVAERTKKTATTDLTGSVKPLAANGTGSLTLGLTEDNAGSQALLVTVSSREASSKGAYIDVVVDTSATNNG